MDRSVETFTVINYGRHFRTKWYRNKFRIMVRIMVSITFLLTSNLVYIYYNYHLVSNNN